MNWLIKLKHKVFGEPIEQLERKNRGSRGIPEMDALDKKPEPIRCIAQSILNDLAIEHEALWTISDINDYNAKTANRSDRNYMLRTSQGASWYHATIMGNGYNFNTTEEKSIVQAVQAIEQLRCEREAQAQKLEDRQALQAMFPNCNIHE